MVLEQEEPVRSRQSTVIIDLREFHKGFDYSIKKACKTHEISDEDRETLVGQLINLILQFQSANAVENMGRQVLMAVNIVRDSGIMPADEVVSKWTSMLLYLTSRFVSLRLTERSPLWKLDAYVEGSVYISPGD